MMCFEVVVMVGVVKVVCFVVDVVLLFFFVSVFMVLL